MSYAVSHDVLFALLVVGVCMALTLASFLVLEGWWFFVKMPRWRRQFIAEMKAAYPEDYVGRRWPVRWQDRLYEKFAR